MTADTLDLRRSFSRSKPGTKGLVVTLAVLALTAVCQDAFAQADPDARSFAMGGSLFVGVLAAGPRDRFREVTSADSATYSAYRERRSGVGPGFELAFQSRSRRNAFGVTVVSSWSRGKTTITQGDGRADVSDGHRMVAVLLTGDWRFGTESPFHAGVGFGSGFIKDRQIPNEEPTLLLLGSFWLGADWALAGSHLRMGPRVRVDGGFSPEEGTSMVGGAGLFDVLYWF